MTDFYTYTQVNIAGVDQSNAEIQRKKVEAWWNPTSSIFELLTKACHNVIFDAQFVIMDEECDS